MIECLSHKKSSLCRLILHPSGFTEQHMYHPVLLLVHSHSLQHLDLAGNSLSTGFDLICAGLKRNKCLTLLNLRYVTLSDNDLLLLADALHEHSKLLELDLTSSNSFQSTIFFQFLQKLFNASSRSCLFEIWVDSRQYYPAIQQLDSYQASQQQNGLPQIELEICKSDVTDLP